MIRLFAVLLIASAATAGGTGSGEATPKRPPVEDTNSLAPYATVFVPPSKTSVYVGSVTMTMSTLARTAGVYEGTYAAKVFPYFFYNETGKLVVEIGDDDLRKLARGEAVDFKGRGVRSDGAVRPIEGRATPADATTGKLKVRVFYSKRVELIFNTTYRFEPAK